MLQTSPIFRVFVSSTFDDFKKERDALQNVFWLLRQRCESRGARFQAVDLRWGVSEEASLDQQAMPLCLEEIARSRRVTPRPNFIVLLGDRYGWRPLPTEIPDADFVRILAGVARRSDRELLTDWYERDDNAVPPSWILRPRDAAVPASAGRRQQILARKREAEAWRVTEDRLRRILLAATRRRGLARPVLPLSGASAVQQEVEAGLLGPKDSRGQAFAFLRSIQDLPDDASAHRFRDFDRQERVDRAAQRALARLRRQVSERLAPGNVFHYRASWTRDSVASDHLDELCRDVEESLWRVIESELEGWSERDPLEIEIAAHREFADERRRLFVGRTEARERITAYLAGAERRPLLVRGVAGTGKSALMAQAAVDATESQLRAVVVSRFIGSTAASTVGSQLLRGICVEIGRAVGAEDPVPDGYQELVAYLQTLLERASGDRPLILFVDALDQLEASDPAVELDWLPRTLPEHVRVVLSILTLDTASRPSLRSEEVLELEPMKPKEGEQLLDQWLRSVHRTLTAEQRREVLKRFAGCPLPLYLRLAFEEARRWRSHDSPPELAADTGGLIEDMLARLGDDANHGRVLVERSLGYLAAARNGLTEDELIDALSLDDAVMDDFRRRSPESPAMEQLPPIVWSRLFSDLEPYLARRSADGTSTLGFYHRELGEVVAQEFLSGRSRLDRTRHLARYFEAQRAATQLDGRLVANLRTLSELPFLQTRGALWGRLERTLCDLDFVTAKCAAGRTYDLIEDYASAARSLPESRHESRTTEERAARVRAFAEELATYSRRWADARRTALREPRRPERDAAIPAAPSAVRPWSDDQFKQRLGRAARETSRADRIGAFGQFVNAESHRLVEFVRLPTYLGQQAYNASGLGPVALAAEEHVEVLCRIAPAILARQWSRPDHEFYPPIIRTLDSSVDADGGAVAMTPDGRRAVSSDDAGFRTWDLATGQLIAAVDAGQGRVGAVALTADGGVAVTGNGDNTVRVWDADSGQCLRVLRGHTDRPGAVCVTPDGGLVASGGSFGDTSVRVWDPDTAACIHTLTGHEGEVVAIGITANGSRVVSGSEDRTIRIWDVDAGRCVKVLRAHRTGVKSVTVTPDGRRMVSCGDEEKAVVWDLERGVRLRTLGGSRQWPSPMSAAITADGRLVIGAEHIGLVIWDAATGDVIHVVTSLAGTVGAIQHIAATADGSLVLTGSYFGLLNLWDVTRGYHEFTEGELFTGNVRSVAFTATGRQAVVANSNGALFLNEDTRTGRDTLVLQGGHSGRSWVAASISADGARLVATGTDGGIAIYDQRGKRLHTLKAGAGYLSFLTAGPDGRQLLAGGEDRTLRLWDLETRSNPRELTGHPDAVQAAAIAPDGVLAVSGSADDFGASPKMLLLWDLRAGKRVRALKGHKWSVYAVAFTADGRHVVSGGLDFSVRVWDARSSECLRVLEGHTDEVLGLAATADGRSVISGSRDQTVRLWDLESGDCLAVATLPYVITTLALSGRELIVGGQGGNVRQFELRDPSEGTGRATLGYRYDHNRRSWEPGPRAICPWCGWRFRPPVSVSAAIDSITESLNAGRSPCLELPDEAFDVPALGSVCARCKASLVFNPFVLDTRGRW